jgi:hypothetical protein
MAPTINRIESEMIAKLDRSLQIPKPDTLYGGAVSELEMSLEQNKNLNSSARKVGLHPLFVRWLEPVLAAAEGGRAGQAVALDNGASGLSLGRLQMDLAQQAELRAALAAFARARLLDLDTSGPGETAKRVDLATLFAKRTDRLTKSERAQAERLGQRLLAWPGAAAVLARYERLKLVRIGLALRGLIGQAHPDAAAFARSLRGQIEIGCHLHQFGTGSTQRLAAFLAGGEVAFEGIDGKTRRTRFAGPLTREQFRNFRRATRWGAANPRANESRHARIDHATAALPADA